MGNNSSPSEPSTPFWSLPVQEAEKTLHTNTSQGLSASQAQERLSQYGANALRQSKKRGVAARFFSQFKSVMILILLVAAVVSGITGYMEGEGITDALIILVIVVVNACIGTAQEIKAENALAALERMTAPLCTVLRDGQARDIAVKDLVPGDVVLLEAGDRVPADLRLAEAASLKIEEAALTGESVPADKGTAPLAPDTGLGDRDNMAFASTTVTYGRGKGLVTATGMQTEMGKIAHMLETVPETRSPLQIKIDQLGRILGFVSLAICLFIFAAGYLQGREVLGMFMIAVSLAVAAIPEGLPAVSTVVLAVGMQRLAKKKAIVRNLPSVEALGSTTTICSDKTGTLTQNRMAVTSLFTDTGTAPGPVPQTLTPVQKQLLLGAILANDATMGSQGEEALFTGDPTEIALVELGLRFDMDKPALEAAYPRTGEIPFDSDRKMMSTINRDKNGHLALYIKGGPDEVLARCNRILVEDGPRALDEATRHHIRQANQAMAEEALRVLAVAYTDLEVQPEELASDNLEHNLIFCGLVGMMDPPREEVKAAVALCRTAGIRPVMITGDHLTTAIAIARELGIKRPEDESVTGSALDGMTDEKLDTKAPHIAVYARVAPEQKVRIVRALQHRGAVVAMTGDGVNDAPALKLADIGVAMGITGTDVAKEAADVVLADDNFATIVTAVEEGRRIYDNILKAVQFLLSTNLGEVLVIAVAILAGWPPPLLPVQILWINLVSDSLPALALSVDPAEDDIMERQPVDSKAGILRGAYLVRIILQGIMIAALSLAAFLIGMNASVETAQTMAFAVLGCSQVAHAFNVRSARHSAFVHMFNNKMLVAALSLVLFLLIIVLEVPALHDIFHLTTLTGSQWVWVGVLSLAPLPLVEAVKALVRLTGR